VREAWAVEGDQTHRSSQSAEEDGRKFPIPLTPTPTQNAHSYPLRTQAVKSHKKYISVLKKKAECCVERDGSKCNFCFSQFVVHLSNT